MSTAVRHDVMVAGVAGPARHARVADRGSRHLHVVPTSAQGAPASGARSVVMARRRFAVLVLALVALAGAVFAGRAVASGVADGGASTVTVQPGETLSQIAAREMPQWANGAAVVELERVNGLDSSRVGAGQHLVIPAA